MLLILSAMLLLGLALITIRLSLVERDKDLDEDDGIDPILERNRRIPTFLNRYINRMGLDLHPVTVWSLVLILLFVSMVFVMTQPTNVALMLTMAMLVIANTGLKVLGERRKQRLLGQLPSFLNQVARRLSAGVSVEHAFTDSVDGLEAPLSESIKRVMQRTALGMDLHRAFEREARTSDIREFHIIATAMRINEQFGGSIRSVLEDIVDILRLDDQSKRELKAQTGETRITAVVLSALPITIGGWMMLKNPKFLEQMWFDSLGQFLLLLAAGMLVSGIFALWRMVRSV